MSAWGINRRYLYRVCCGDGGGGRRHGRQLESALLAILGAGEGGDGHLVLRQPPHLLDFILCIFPDISVPLLECAIGSVIVHSSCPVGLALQCEALGSVQDLVYIVS